MNPGREHPDCKNTYIESVKCLKAFKILPIQQGIIYIYPQILSTTTKKTEIQYSLYQKQIPRRYLVIWDLPNQSGYINDTINASAPHKELLNIREESTHMNTSSAAV